MKHVTHSVGTALAARHTPNSMNLTEANEENEDGTQESLFPWLPSVPKFII